MCGFKLSFLAYIIYLICVFLLSQEEKQHLSDVFLPCSGNEAVEQGVCKTVEGSYSSAYLVNTEEPFKALAAIQQHADNHSDVDRSEAKQKAQKNHRQ